MTADEDFEAYRREQLTQVRDIHVTTMGLQSFEEGLVRIIVRSEGSSQELKVNERELEALLHAAGAQLSKKIPAYLQLQEIGQRAAELTVPEQQLAFGRRDLATLKMAVFEAQRHTAAVAANPHAARIDLQDASMDEMKAWQTYAEALEQRVSFPGGGFVPVKAPTVTIRDSAGVPVFEIETTTEEQQQEATLDPKPWFCTSCSDRFVRFQQSPTSHVTVFKPRPQYEQRRMAYPDALDPQPWHAIAPEGKSIKGPTRFAREEQGYSNGETVFDPRPQYEQEKGYYA